MYLASVGFQNDQDSVDGSSGRRRLRPPTRCEKSHPRPWHNAHRHEDTDEGAAMQDEKKAASPVLTSSFTGPITQTSAQIPQDFAIVRGRVARSGAQTLWRL